MSEKSEPFDRVLVLSGAVESAIVEHARACSPEECCGLLVGIGHHVTAAAPMNNCATDRTRRYRIDPRQHFDVIRTARQQSLAVIGVYHSHPRSSAAPSPTDREEGFGNFIFLIVGFGEIWPEITAWTWADGNFTAMPIVRSPKG